MISQVGGEGVREDIRDQGGGKVSGKGREDRSGKGKKKNGWKTGKGKSVSAALGIIRIRISKPRQLEHDVHAFCVQVSLITTAVMLQYLLENSPSWPQPIYLVRICPSKLCTLLFNDIMDVTTCLCGIRIVTSGLHN